MISVLKLVVPVALALSACLLPAHATETPEAIKAAVDGAFRPLLEQYDVPGLAVAVTVDGQAYFFNYGVASRAGGEPVTQNTLFEIGSVSKTFAATLAAQAVAQGRMSLDDHPSKFMPQLSGSAIDKASLLHLATYTAGGLPLQFPNAVGDDAEMLAYFQGWTPSAAPGEQRLYSNPSIGLFGHLAGRAMGGDFPDLVTTEIFSRLGLGHTYVRVPEAEMANYAWGYNNANKPVRAYSGLLGSEAYGVRSTAADMIAFVQANIQPESTSLQSAIEGTHIGYFRIGEIVQGLGWEQYPYPVSLERLLDGNSDAMARKPNAAMQLVPPQVAPASTLFNKTGSTNGFGTYVAFVPAENIGIVMLANRNFPNSARVTAAYAVLQQLAGAAP